jgi:hypothetical protein
LTRDARIVFVSFQGNERARRNALSEELVEHFYEDVNTLYEGFMRGVQVAGKQTSAFSLAMILERI